MCSTQCLIITSALLNTHHPSSPSPTHLLYLNPQFSIVKSFLQSAYELLFLKIYLFEREREHKWGERQRVKERESQADLLNAERDVGLDPRTLRSWPEPKPQVGCPTNWATQAPHELFFYYYLQFYNQK